MKKDVLITQKELAEILGLSNVAITRAKQNNVFPPECFVDKDHKKYLNKKLALAAWIVHASTNANADSEARAKAMQELKKIKNEEVRYDYFDEDDIDDIEDDEDDEGGGTSLDYAKLKDIQARTRLTEIRTEKFLGELIERTKLMQILGAMHSAIANRFQSLPARVATAMHGAKTVHEAEVYLAKEIESICLEISAIELNINEEITSI